MPPATSGLNRSNWRILDQNEVRCDEKLGVELIMNRILVVDPESSIREALAKVLRAENYDVCLLPSSFEALQRHRADPMDLLLVDVDMPNGNGGSSLAWLRDIEPRVPLIVITGLLENAALVRKAGADAFMPKPLDVPLLLRTIRELLNHEKINHGPG